MITLETRDALVVAYAPAGCATARLQRVIEETETLLIRHCGGTTVARALVSGLIRETATSGASSGWRHGGVRALPSESMTIDARVDALPWAELERSLWERGYAWSRGVPGRRGVRRARGALRG